MCVLRYLFQPSYHISNLNTSVLRIYCFNSTSTFSFYVKTTLTKNSSSIMFLIIICYLVKLKILVLFSFCFFLKSIYSVSYKYRLNCGSSLPFAFTSTGPSCTKLIKSPACILQILYFKSSEHSHHTALVLTFIFLFAEQQSLSNPSLSGPFRTLHHQFSKFVFIITSSNSSSPFLHFLNCLLGHFFLFNWLNVEYYNWPFFLMKNGEYI